MKDREWEEAKWECDFRSLTLSLLTQGALEQRTYLRVCPALTQRNWAFLLHIGLSLAIRGCGMGWNIKLPDTSSVSEGNLQVEGSLQVLAVSSKIWKTWGLAHRIRSRWSISSTVSFLLTFSPGPMTHAIRNSYYKFKASKGLALKCECHWTQTWVWILIPQKELKKSHYWLDSLSPKPQNGIIIPIS